MAAFLTYVQRGLKGKFVIQVLCLTSHNVTCGQFAEWAKSNEKRSLKKVESKSLFITAKIPLLTCGGPTPDTKAGHKP